jgi:hypothetical protein
MKEIWPNNNAMHRMTAPRHQLTIRTLIEGGVIGDLGRWTRKRYMLMKRLIVFLIVGLLFPVLLISAEPAKTPLKDVILELKGLEDEQIRNYKWMSVIQKDAKRESKDYARLIVVSKSANEELHFHDTITLAPSYKGMIFDRRLTFPKADLLAPQGITIDITGGGKTVRQFDYEGGEANFIEFSGATNTTRWSFEGGILTFNMLLRVAPQLPREIGRVYTFRAYAEPFLFRIHEVAEGDTPFTLTCEASEEIRTGRKSYDCVRFSLDLKSAEVRTDIWVCKDNNLVVRFVDVLPEGADASFLEATIQE